ncbi:MAG: four helix bundle protein [Bdellovibrio sp.]|nr:four helix bundle protein [Bdellovibrio sp.]
MNLIKIKNKKKKEIKKKGKIKMLTNFRTYQQAMKFYKSAERLKLKGNKRDQFERAILSIVLNLSEGSAKSSAKEREKFYRISLGSLREVQTLLDLFGTPELIHEADCLGASLYCLCRGCRNSYSN